MIKLFILVAVLFPGIYIHAQQVNPNNDVKTIPTQNSKTSVERNDKFNLPPEKLIPVKIPRFETAPTIDGKLDEAIWRQAASFRDFYQISPGDNAAPSKPTIAYLGYDKQNLYIAFHCFDEPDKIRATFAKRDAILGEDNVRIWLDTYNDRRRAYLLAFNPLGIQQDGIYNEGQGYDYTVDVVMESKGMIVSDGWTVEVKIPFKSLRYVAGKEKLWGFNVARSINRFNDELDSWLPDDRNVSGFLIKHGKITGIEGLATGRTLEIVPSVTISETGRRTRTISPSVLSLNPQITDPGRFVNQPINQDFGVNIKLGITSNITLDAAINPDFAEIESDNPVVTANQRFPIFFAEKRPFFLEGVEIFQSSLQIFHSRTIVDPDAAIKLTGKIGRESFGFLAATDKAPGNYSQEDRDNPAVRPRIDEFLDKNANFGIIRLKHDVGQENYIGYFGTYRSFPEQRNATSGVDGRIKFNPRTFLRFQTVATHSRRCFFDPFFEPTLKPEQATRNRAICDGATFNEYRTGNGFGYSWLLSYKTKSNERYISAVGRTKDYRADAGFTNRTNTNSYFFANQFNSDPDPKGQIIDIKWRQFSRIDFDWKNRSQLLRFGNDFNISLQRNSYIYLEAAITRESIYEDEFGLSRSTTRNGAFFGDAKRSAWQQYANGSFSTTPTKRLYFDIFLGFSNNVFDFDSGNGRRFPRISPAALSGDSRIDPGGGKQFDFSTNIEIKPTYPFRISFGYNKRRLTRNDNDRTVFDSNIYTIRSTYQFSRFMFLRTRLDYNSLSSGGSGQILFGWNPNPGTAFYAGYNDNFNYNGYNPFTGQFEPQYVRNNRTFFIRISYLFRKNL